MAFTEDDLRKLGLEKDAHGNYSKKKVAPLEEKKWVEKRQSLEKIKDTSPQIFRSLKLTLFGEPMAKQSVRIGKNGHAFQPKVKTDKVKDYQSQIRKQLPKDFVRFETAVFIKKLHFMFSPLKSFHKEKGKMDAIRNGKKYYKNSRPDMDNLQKLVLDSMSEIVFADDGIIVGFEDMKKYYGIGGCVIIELEGY